MTIRGLAGLSKSQPLVIIGLMSGTSVDGVDACCVKLWQDADNNVLQHQILGTGTKPMLPHLRERLLTCMQNKPVALSELCSLDNAVGMLFTDAAKLAMNAANLTRHDITAIASHGQTLFHMPPKGEGMIGNTLQIGNAALIAEQLEIPVISNFRKRDMAVGGHGAPLVCLADRYLFQSDKLNRCVQNIGGIANVTVLPATQSVNAAQSEVFAFDTGPGNMLIDGAMRTLFGRSYDKNGELAAAGHCNELMLSDLLNNPYFTQEPPKSTGRELFGQAALEKILGQYAQVPPADMIATLTAFTAQSLVDAYCRFILPICPVDEMILGGGGVYNITLRGFISQGFEQKGKKIAIKTHQDFNIPDQYKEALAFAILAWASLHGLPGNIPSCTGADKPVLLGSLDW